ncbi:MAG: DEAD/DEAH box helicase [Thermoanaerobaculia bacterium]|nr:DEAD/DEAH box helicase [Thermoanaerobaculia bacterium]
MSSPTPEPAVSFSDLGLVPAIVRAIDEVGYETPSPIQAQAIPPLLAGRDLLGQAQTGTGKTAAFALPLLSRLDLARRQPQILVLTPTRELALQVAEAMQTYARHLEGFHIVPIYGGQGFDSQLRQLHRGVHVVVGTPGRVQDHLRRGTLVLDGLAAVVLDEADEMLRMGFLEEVEQILQHTPSEKQVALFSATMPAPIREVAERYLREPVAVEIRAKTATVETVSQTYLRVHGSDKLEALTRILEAEDFDAMLIFVRTRIATTDLAEKLEARGFACAPLNGDMNQAMRERTIERLKKGKLDIVVATDVAARGLDVDRISHVLNYDIPYDVEAYVHRIGRTARAGRSGRAILFVSPRERNMLMAIERVTRQRIEPMRLPSRADVADRRVAQFKQTITEAIEAQELDLFEKIVESYRDETETDLKTIAAALAFLVQRERPILPPELARELAAPRPAFPVETLLIERPTAIARELYLGLLLERETARVLFVASQAGGMDIERVAAEMPERLLRVRVHPAVGLQPYQVRRLGFGLDLDFAQIKSLGVLMQGLYRLFIESDASLVEVNPLVVDDRGELIALDARSTWTTTPSIDIPSWRHCATQARKTHASWPRNGTS